MTRIVFEEVRIKGVRRWTENGKKRQQTKVFWQTRNPFNKNENGVPKSFEEIKAELVRERNEWLKGTGE